LLSPKVRREGGREGGRDADVTFFYLLPLLPPWPFLSAIAGRNDDAETCLAHGKEGGGEGGREE